MARLCPVLKLLAAQQIQRACSGSDPHPFSGADAIVELIVCPGRLGVPDYCALLYLFMHELIAHAYHGVRVLPGPRIETDRADPFAEGWMDFVALVTLSNWMDAKTEADFDIPDFEVSRKERAKECATGRRVVGPPDNASGSYAHAALMGTRAAEKALENLYTHGGSAEDFIRLSCSMNAFPGTTEDHRALVGALEPATNRVPLWASASLMSYLREAASAEEVRRQLMRGAPGAG